MDSLDATEGPGGHVLDALRHLAPKVTAHPVTGATALPFFTISTTRENERRQILTPDVENASYLYVKAEKNTESRSHV